MMLPSMGNHTYHLAPRQRYRLVADYLGGHKVSDICRFYGVPRKTFYYWLGVWKRDPDNFSKNVARTDNTPKNQPALTSRATTELIIRLRKKSKFGPQKLKLLLAERGVIMSAAGIYKVLKRANLIKTHRKKIKKKYKKYSAFMKTPGQKVQVDVAYTSKLFGRSHRYYAYQAIDLNTRITYSALYPECTPQNTVLFLKRALSYFPFKIQWFQFDHGTEFTYDMLVQVNVEHPVHTYLKSQNIAFCFAPVATPRMNGCIERVHQTWRQEVERWHKWKTEGKMFQDNQKWMRYYNEHRPHSSLNMLTPLKKLQTHTGFENAKLNYAI